MFAAWPTVTELVSSSPLAGGPPTLSHTYFHVAGPRKIKDSLKSLLDNLRDLDLTGKITEESPFLKAHGGYSDVFSGKSLRHGGMQVAIKRLRVHLLESQKTAKVRPIFDSRT